MYSFISFLLVVGYDFISYITRFEKCYLNYSALLRIALQMFGKNFIILIRYSLQASNPICLYEKIFKSFSIVVGKKVILKLHLWNNIKEQEIGGTGNRSLYFCSITINQQGS